MAIFIQQGANYGLGDRLYYHQTTPGDTYLFGLNDYSSGVQTFYVTNNSTTEHLVYATGYSQSYISGFKIVAEKSFLFLGGSGPNNSVYVDTSTIAVNTIFYASGDDFHGEISKPGTYANVPASQAYTAGRINVFGAIVNFMSDSGHVENARTIHYMGQALNHQWFNAAAMYYGDGNSFYNEYDGKIDFTGARSDWQVLATTVGNATNGYFQNLGTIFASDTSGPMITHYAYQNSDTPSVFRLFNQGFIGRGWNPGSQEPHQVHFINNSNSEIYRDAIINLGTIGGGVLTLGGGDDEVTNQGAIQSGMLASQGNEVRTYNGTSYDVKVAIQMGDGRDYYVASGLGRVYNYDQRSGAQSAAGISGGEGGDYLAGGGQGPAFFGDGGDDILISTGGYSFLDGGAGADKLDASSAGVGSRTDFVFAAALSPTNVDTIVGFKAGQDRINLDKGVFGTLAANADGTLKADYVTWADQSNAAHAQILITSTGDLLYDADGVGGAAAVKFAHFQGYDPMADEVSASDFYLKVFYEDYFNG